MPWRRKWQPTPVFLPGKSPEHRSLAGTVHGVAKSRKRLSSLTTLSIFSVVGLFGFGHNSCCLMASRISLYFPDNCWNWLLFKLCWPFMFHKMSCQLLHPFFLKDCSSYWVVGNLYISWRSVFFQINVFQIFFPVCSFPVHFFNHVFWMYIVKISVFSLTVIILEILSIETFAYL